MASVTTKFSMADVCYSFDNIKGIIYRHTIKEISINTTNTETEIMYKLIGAAKTNQNSVTSAFTTIPEQDLYTEDEVKDLANVWLIDKSVSIFSAAGL